MSRKFSYSLHIHVHVHIYAQGWERGHYGKGISLVYNLYGAIRLRIHVLYIILCICPYLPRSSHRGSLEEGNPVVW